MKLEKLLANCFDHFAWPQQSRWFKRGLYLIVAGACLYHLTQVNFLFGENSYIYRRAQPFSGLHDLAYLLYGHPQFGLLFLVLAFVISLAGLLNHRWMMSDLILWLLMVNIGYALYAGQSGGDLLLQQLLFFNVFISYATEKKSLFSASLRHFLHNAGASAVQVQICLLYAVAAIAKLGDPQWLTGTAVWQTSLIQHFNLYSGPVFRHLSAWTKFLNYAVLIYQLLFPIIIWYKVFRKIFLLIGFVIYLYIAVFMGIMDFATVVLLGHVFFWPSSKVDS
jgi:hypothetical protein